MLIHKNIIIYITLKVYSLPSPKKKYEKSFFFFFFFFFLIALLSVHIYRTGRT